MTAVTLVVLAVVIIAIVAALVVLLTRRKPAPEAPPLAADPSRSSIAPPTPMTGLESALDQVTDRSGRKLRDKLEDEAAIVDDLRIPDDTGPLLRRALDRVEQPGDQPGDEPGEQPGQHGGSQPGPGSA